MLTLRKLVHLIQHIAILTTSAPGLKQCHHHTTPHVASTLVKICSTIPSILAVPSDLHFIIRKCRANLHCIKVPCTHRWQTLRIQTTSATYLLSDDGRLKLEDVRESKRPLYFALSFNQFSIIGVCTEAQSFGLCA